MPEKPVIIVQLIHIEGPLKGNIEECADPVIRIGRHLDCQLRFPRDLTIVSRKHAKIVREGNRFKLVDHSTNGTFLNGKGIKETFLKTGDVLMIGEGGPKVSFLTEIQAGRIEDSGLSAGNLGKETPAVSQAPPVSRPQPPPQDVPHAPTPDWAASEPSRQSLLSQAPAGQKPSNISVAKRGPDPSEARVQAPLVILFGPTIQSFKTLPVVVGKKDDCDFIINHADIIDRHVQIFFSENNYWVKDLTGRGLITINDAPIQVQTPLHPGSQLALGPRGPVFQFFDGGRLAEITDQPAEKDFQKPPKNPASSWQKAPEYRPRRKGLLLFSIGLLVILTAILVWMFFVNPSTINGTETGGLKEWWYRLVEAIQQIVG